MWLWSILDTGSNSRLKPRRDPEMGELLEKLGKSPENSFVAFSYFIEILKCRLNSYRITTVLTL
jgi:hypothetical protein